MQRYIIFFYFLNFIVNFFSIYGCLAGCEVCWCDSFYGHNELDFVGFFDLLEAVVVVFFVERAR